MAGLKLSFNFVVVLYHVFMATCFCYSDNNMFPSSDEIQKLLNSLNKPPVKSIKSLDGDIIDCVHISRQPAFDHPLLKNHTIKVRPNYHPTWINMMNASKDRHSSSSVTQLWHSNGKCPKRTIPIRRTKKEDVLRANSFRSYGKKKSTSVAQPSSIDVELDVSRRYEFAYAYTRGEFYATIATLNLWNPRIQESNEYSLAQIWIIGGDLDTIEAGWQVDPELYGDTNTRLFIYWTSDGFQRKGCFNLECSGFIQISNKIALGATMSPTSVIYGSQHDITIIILKDVESGDWLMVLNDEIIGYWPSELFSQLSGDQSASLIEWGGAVANSEAHGHHTTTQMGSGRLPNQGYKNASYIKNIEIVDTSYTLGTPDVNLVMERGCYEILTGINDDWGRYIYFGGPGLNSNCP
ncbi:putative neprosin [Helianthus debilis subsp. tardiflorus]